MHPCVLVDTETVKQADAVGFRQIRLRTATCTVSGVPGTAAAPIAVGKTDLGVRPAVGNKEVPIRRARRRGLIAGPVVAGVIDTIRECGPIGLSPGKHFVASRKTSVFGVLPVVVARIGIVIQTGHDLAFFGEAGELIQIIALMREFHRIAMEMGQILRDHFAFEVVPGAFADAVARIDGGLAGSRLRAQVGVPCFIAGAYGSGERLAMRVSAGESAEIAAVTNGFTGHEKAHHRRRLDAARIFTGSLRLGKEQSAGEQDCAGEYEH